MTEPQTQPAPLPSATRANSDFIPARDLTKADVEGAIAEARRVGRDKFLSSLGASPADKYFVVDGDFEIDAKPIVQWAWSSRRPNQPIKANEFRGDRQKIAEPLRKLGFVVEEREHVDTADLSNWNIEVGRGATRIQIHEQYGGSRFPGISPSVDTPNVMIYSDPSEGEFHGYGFDGWVEGNSIFHYTGHGPVGDQEMKSGNRALRDHQLDGRSLRVFVADGIEQGTKETKRQLYLGEFAVDGKEPYFVAEGLDANGDPRAVFVFRLSPIGTPFVRPEDRATIPPRASVIKVEEIAVERQHRHGSNRAGAAPMAAVRREAALVDRYMADLVAAGHEVTSYKITPKGHVTPLRVDLFDKKTGELCEAKGSTTRESIRLAIGQLLDYKRLLDNEGRVQTRSLSVLVPTRPDDALLDLLSSLKITCAYEEDNGFERLEPAPG